MTVQYCNIAINLKNLSAFGFQFWLLQKSSKVPSIFLGFWSIQSVKLKLIMNSKKALFAVTYAGLMD